MKKVEIGFLVILFIACIANIWITDEEVTFGLFSIVLSIFSLTYLFGGYYIIKPKKSKNQWKLGSILSGIFISITLFMLIGKISEPNIPNTVFLLFLIPLFICTVYLTSRAFFINSDKSKKLYFQKVLSKVSIIFLTVLVITVLPRDLLVKYIFSSNSEIYFTSLQNKYFNEANQLRYNGECYQAKNKIDIALSYFEQQNDRSSALYQKCVCELGRIFLEQGEYKKADSTFNIVLMLYRLDNPENIKSKYNNDYQEAYYTAIYNSSGVQTSFENLNKSDSLLSIALDYFNDNLPLAYIYHGFGINEFKRNKFNSADSLLLLSLEYQKKTNYSDNRKYISTLQQLALSKIENSNFHAADSILSICDSYSRKEFGEYHQIFASIMDIYVQLNMTLANYNKAKNICLKSLEIKERVFGKEDSKYLQSLMDLSNIYIITSKYLLADSLLKHITPIIEFNFDNRSPIACRLYDILCANNEAKMFYKEAEEYALKSVYGRTYWYGANNLSTANSYNNLASVLYYQSDYLTADTLYSITLTIIKDSKGIQNMSYVNSLNGYSLVLIEQDSLEIANVCLEYCESTCELKQGLHHPNYATILLNKAHLRTKQKKNVDARELYHQALSIYEDVFNEKNIKIAKTYYELGNFEILNNNIKFGISYYEKSIKIYQELFGEDHFFVIDLNDQINLLKESIISQANSAIS